MTGFWVYMLAFDLLIPLTMIFFGRRFAAAPPKSINPLFGYRTAMSMKNEDTWAFAHRFCGRLWFRSGLALLPLSLVPLAFVMGRDVDTIGWVGAAVCCAQLLPLIAAIPLTERALKRAFDESGNRRA